MANPQLENGHTQIANEIIEQLIKTHLSPNEWQVLLCIVRKTYGFHKKVDSIANCQLVEATGLCKAVVSRVLRVLNDKHMITRNGKLIGFQKDWSQWQKLAVSSTVSSLANSEPRVSNIVNSEKLAIPSTKLAILSEELAISSTKVSSPHVTQKIKETITKETIQKKVYGEFGNVLLFPEEYDKLINRLGKLKADDLIEQLSAYMKRDPKNAKKYADHYATILTWSRRDNRTDVRTSKSIPGNKPAGAFADLDEAG